MSDEHPPALAVFLTASAVNPDEIAFYVDASDDIGGPAAPEEKSIIVSDDRTYGLSIYNAQMDPLLLVTRSRRIEWGLDVAKMLNIEPRRIPRAASHWTEALVYSTDLSRIMGVMGVVASDAGGVVVVPAAAVVLNAEGEIH